MAPSSLFSDTQKLFIGYHAFGHLDHGFKAVLFRFQLTSSLKAVVPCVASSGLNKSVLADTKADVPDCHLAID